MKKKIELMKRLEKEGLGFTANVIMNGCGKPVTKMATIVSLLDSGHNVRSDQFDSCAVIIDGYGFSLGVLDEGMRACLDRIEMAKKVEAEAKVGA